MCVFVQTVPKTLSPQWREQFDLHLYEETGGVLEITVWDKDTGRRDDFIGRSESALFDELLYINLKVHFQFSLNENSSDMNI